MIGALGRSHVIATRSRDADKSISSQVNQ